MNDFTEAEHFRERAGQGEQILHAIRRAVGLEFNNGVSLLDFIGERWISDEMISAAVQSAHDPNQPKEAQVAKQRVLRIFKIKKCPRRHNRHTNIADGIEIPLECPGCAKWGGHGWTIGGEHA
jgi:hypothetical protein